MGPCMAKSSRQEPHTSQIPSKPVITAQNWILDQHIIDQSMQFGSESVERVPYKDMAKLHHRLLGAIICHDSQKNMQTGTGILLSPNLVLTCAHVIVNAKENEPFPNIDYYPRQYGELTKAIKVQSHEYPQEYTQRNPGYKSYDYALLKLSQKVDEQQFIELYGGMSEKEQHQTISIFGYPESKYEKHQGQLRQIKQFGLAKEGYVLNVLEEAGYLMHRISTEKGQSGAPVVKQNSKGKLTIIGLHVGTTKEDNYLKIFKKQHPNLEKVNLTKIINMGVIHRLQKFAVILKGQPFGIYTQNASKIRESSKLTQDQSEEIRSLKKQLAMIKKISQEQKKLLDENVPLDRKKSPKIKSEIRGMNVSTSKLIDLHHKGQEAKTPKHFNAEGNKLIEYKKFAEAIRSHRKAVDMEPSNAQFSFDLGTALDKNCQLDEAIKWYKKATELKPKFLQAHHQLAQTLGRVNRLQEAIDAYVRVIKIDLQFNSAYSQLKKLQWQKVSLECVLRTKIFMNKILNPDKDIKDIIRILENEIDKKRKQK